MNILFILLVIFLLIFIVWISSVFFGAPFQPSSDKALREIIELSEIKKSNKSQKVADLGSGNGKIVIEFAKQGMEAHGFEINPILVWTSRIKIKKLGLENKAFIHRKNFWKQDFSDFDIVTSFQINYVMPRLEEKLKKELRSGAKIISNTWQFPNWKPKKKLEDIYLYEKV